MLIKRFSFPVLFKEFGKQAWFPTRREEIPKTIILHNKLSYNLKSCALITSCKTENGPYHIPIRSKNINQNMSTLQLRWFLMIQMIPVWPIKWCLSYLNVYHCRLCKQLIYNKNISMSRNVHLRLERYTQTWLSFFVICIWPYQIQIKR